MQKLIFFFEKLDLFLQLCNGWAPFSFFSLQFLQQFLHLKKLQANIRLIQNCKCIEKRVSSSNYDNFMRPFLKSFTFRHLKCHMDYSSLSRNFQCFRFTKTGEEKHNLRFWHKKLQNCVWNNKMMKCFVLKHWFFSCLNGMFFFSNDSNFQVWRKG